jgi:hypothetical protein
MNAISDSGAFPANPGVFPEITPQNTPAPVDAIMGCFPGKAAD